MTAILVENKSHLQPKITILCLVKPINTNNQDVVSLLFGAWIK